MSNYTLKTPILANIPSYIEKDSTKLHLENFKEVSLIGDYKPCKEKTEKFSKKVIEKIVLCQILLCHSSYRGLKEFSEIIFEYKVSLGAYTFLRKLLHKIYCVKLRQYMRLLYDVICTEERQEKKIE